MFLSIAMDPFALQSDHEHTKSHLPTSIHVRLVVTAMQVAEAPAVQVLQ